MRYPCVDTTSERSSGRRQESLHAPYATSPAAGAGLVAGFLLTMTVTRRSSGLGLLGGRRGVWGSLVGCLRGLAFGGRLELAGVRAGLLGDVVVVRLDVLVLVLILVDARDRGDGALEVPHARALGDLQLDPIVADPGDGAEHPADGDHFVALLEHRHHFLVLLLLAALRPDGEKVEDPKEDQDPYDDGRASTHAAQPPAE